ncbi:MAG: arabinan endo-1,5-alpha-L-arabinosidase [Prevotella sp.]|nr:arabinan endo-1,5-alpha-L-arabinosidase [Prevotella sp.]
MKKNLFFATALALLSLTACNESTEIVDSVSSSSSSSELPTTRATLSGYQAPTYADDYSSIADWSNRGSWNLANVHDPTVMKADDGYYYMYQTDASYGNAMDGHGHFFCRRSKDLVNWQWVGSTMRSYPSWVPTKINEYRAAEGLSPIKHFRYGYWAPCARKVSTGLYRMYYCIVVDNYIGNGLYNDVANFDNTWTERAFIGVMETSDPASNVWTDKGMVICSSTDKGFDWSRSSLSDWNAYFKFNAIDPSYIICPNGQHYLVYGSWHSGISVVQLDPSTGKPYSLGNPWGDISSYGTLIYSRNLSSRWQASEAPEIIYHDGYYYLFLAYDELSVAYNTRVVRSTSITGPYYGKDGRNVTAKGGEAYPILTHPYRFDNHSGWVGISHCAVFDDGAGNYWYASQGRLPANTNGNAYSNAIMMGHVRSIRWTQDGWPVVMPERYGNVPQLTILESELKGTWQNITMTYQYGQQCTAESMTLGSGHKITAGFHSGGTWSYDKTNAILYIDGIPMYLQREVDWEASPRTWTIVYSGLSNYNSVNNLKSYWGKRN